MSKLSIDSHNVIVTNSRHLDLLSKTLDEIKKIKLSIKQNISSDLLSIDIKQLHIFLVNLQVKYQTMNYWEIYFPSFVSASKLLIIK